MSAHLIGLGCDLQQELDAMDSKLRKARWAGDVGVALYQIAQRLNGLGKRTRSRRNAAIDLTERELMELAQREVNKLGKGIVAVRNLDPRTWPLVIVFPGAVPKDSGPEVVLEQGIAVPPRP